MRQPTQIAWDLLVMHKYEAQSQHKLSLLHTVAEELQLLEHDPNGPAGIGEGLRYSDLSIYGDLPTIRLHYFDGFVGDGAKAVATVAKFLLPKVGKFEKGFNADARRITLTATYRGVQLVLESSPPSTCTIEEVEEEVVIPEQPAIPERTEKRKRYVMKGDCDPLMASVDQEVESVA